MEYEKWEGRTCAKVPSCRVEQVWPLLEDFFSIHKWLPSIETCTPLEGVSGKPGCVRSCASSSDGEMITWVAEKLVSIDHDERCLSYVVVDGNMGIKSYMATMKVLQEVEEEEEEDDDDEEEEEAAVGGGGCTIEWSFEMEAIEGWKLEDLISYVQSNLEGMAKRMEEALLTSCEAETS